MFREIPEYSSFSRFVAILKVESNGLPPITQTSKAETLAEFAPWCCPLVSHLDYALTTTLTLEKRCTV